MQNFLEAVCLGAMEARPRSANGKVIPWGRGFSLAGGGPQNTLHLHRVMNAKFPLGLSVPITAVPATHWDPSHFTDRAAARGRSMPRAAWGSAECGQ